jgi:nitroreductase
MIHNKQANMEQNNDVLKAIHARQCYREFISQPVPAEVLESILQAAARAPSSKNTQPWSVYKASGSVLEAIRAELLQAFDEKQKPRMPYQYGPNPMPDTWMARARQVGFSLFAHKDIKREDKDKRVAHDRENFKFFGAPHVLFLATAKDYGYGTFLDCGMFLQNIMLGMVSHNIGSCPMFSVMTYPDIIQKHLPGSEDKTLICALSYGYPAEKSHVNEFYTIREPLENWFFTAE